MDKGVSSEEASFVVAGRIQPRAGRTLWVRRNRLPES